MNAKLKVLAKKWWFWVIVGLFVLFVIGVCSSNETTSNNETKSNNDSNYSDSTEKSKTTNKSETTKELTESEKMINKISSLINAGLAFDAGNYTAGDIPKGEYAFVKFSGSGSYYCEKDAGDNIIDNENFDSFGYVQVHAAGSLTTKGVLVSTSAFGTLGVSGAKEIYEILNNKENYNQGAWYKVGTDIPEGTYTVESIGSAYYAIMTGPVGNSDIVNNDNFNGKEQVRVKNGQYLKVSRATITKK